MKSILFAFALLSHQSLATRVNDEQVSFVDSFAVSFEDLSSKQEAQVNRALELLENLKEDSGNEQLQAEYHNLIGDVEWASPDDETALGQLDAHGSVHQHSVQPLGDMSAPGEEYTLVELLSGLATKIGRVFTHRRDFAVEPKGGATKYVIDGKVMSLHSRMHILDASGKQLYVLRRSFNYLNPIARLFGQYSYRVVECKAGRPEGCTEGETLFTITKDRLGRGLLWGRDEWRVFTGLGGCTRHGYGLLSCNKDSQILYSLSSGLTHASWGTTYYQGNIKTMKGNGKKAYLYDNEVASEAELKNNFEVAKSEQVRGPPRFLNWPILYAAVEAATGVTGIGLLLKQLQILAKDLVWADAYSVKFTKATDELLIIAMSAVQDLTQDVRAAGMLPSSPKPSQ